MKAAAWGSGFWSARRLKAVSRAWEAGALPGTAFPPPQKKASPGVPWKELSSQLGPTVKLLPGEGAPKSPGAHGQEGWNPWVPQDNRRQRSKQAKLRLRVSPWKGAIHSISFTGQTLMDFCVLISSSDNDSAPIGLQPTSMTSVHLNHLFNHPFSQ